MKKKKEKVVYEHYYDGISPEITAMTLEEIDEAIKRELMKLKEEENHEKRKKSK